MQENEHIFQDVQHIQELVSKCDASHKPVAEATHYISFCFACCECDKRFFIGVLEEGSKLQCLHVFDFFFFFSFYEGKSYLLCKTVSAHTPASLTNQEASLVALAPSVLFVIV